MNLFTFVAPFYNTICFHVQKRQGDVLFKRLVPLEGKDVLDLGGGTGKLAAQLRAAGAEVWVLDASVQMLRRAARVLPADRLIVGYGESMPFPNECFDIITMVDVFHHIRDQRKALIECLRVLRPGGTLCLFEFNPDSFYVRVLALTERVFGEPGLFLTPKKLKVLLEQNGFVQIDTELMKDKEYLILASKPKN